MQSSSSNNIVVSTCFIWFAIIISIFLAGCINPLIQEKQLQHDLNRYQQETNLIGLNREELISLHGLPDKHSHSYINGNVKIEELIFNDENRGSLNAILIDDIVKSATYDKPSNL